ncbi:aminopeptidase [Pilimelia anulata]|uniref:Aminopeptidase n=1 Tax=Pilimelia anulata TaxID=53371 RepID=A0A8J3F9K1_9ACTN|nr:M28 family peptidase [Pilimelia anulata]GGJ97317.1 aminopeptidase [Pilimelia anulata]
MRLRTPILAGTTALAVVAGMLGVTSAAANPTAAVAEQLVPADPPEIPGSAAVAHLTELQKIGEQNGGTRAHGRPGYKASVDYIEGKLKAAGFTVDVQSFSHNGATGYNVIAEWPHGDPNQVGMIGAHLDSVTAGPGINDDGSGSAAVLENALTVARSQVKPTMRMRFGWWGAEELGLIGSKKYVAGLSADEKKKIKFYLNFDMVGQKNIKSWGIYSDSSDISALFKEYFDAKKLTTRGINWGGSSDHSSFKSAGIKVSGIGDDDDPCYHARCDTITNVGDVSMGHASSAIARVFWKLTGAQRTARP